MKIETIWELWNYDVWGNAKDGFEVNDRSCFDREYPMILKVTEQSGNCSRVFIGLPQRQANPTGSWVIPATA